MNAKRWCTKEDVLKDLAEAAGHKATDVDDGFLLYGERPPPQQAFDNDDDEFELRFGRSANTDRFCQDEMVPDLQGIQNMLQMVRDYDDPSENIRSKDVTESKSDLIIISKLNPNVVTESQSDMIKISKLNPNVVTESKSDVVKISKLNPNVVTESKSDVTKISNLNPNVSEFVPRIAMNLSSQSVPQRENKLAKTNGTRAKITSNTQLLALKEEMKSNNKMCNKVDVNSNVSDKIEQEKVICDKNIEKIKHTNKDIQANAAVLKEKNIEKIKHSNKDIQERAAVLKEKISRAAKGDDYKYTKEKNAAIVNLLKLYAAPAVETKPKLYTPEFFERCKASDFVSSAPEVTHNKIGGNLYEPKVEVTHNKIGGNLYEPKLDVTNVTKTGIVDNAMADTNLFTNIDENDEETYDHTTLTPEVDEILEFSEKQFNSYPTVKDKVESVNPEDPEMKESITKVSNWLDNKTVVEPYKKEERKVPMVYLGPVAYKRKDPTTCKSPSEITEKKVPKSAAVEYKPSKYAAELCKKYEERSKAKQTETLNIWEKLQRELKEKDRLIKSRMTKKDANTVNYETES